MLSSSSAAQKKGTPKGAPGFFERLLSPQYKEIKSYAIFMQTKAANTFPEIVIDPFKPNQQLLEKMTSAEELNSLLQLLEFQFNSDVAPKKLTPAITPSELYDQVAVEAKKHNLELSPMECEALFAYACSKYLMYQAWFAALGKPLKANPESLLLLKVKRENSNLVVDYVQKEKNINDHTEKDRTRRHFKTLCKIKVSVNITPEFIVQNESSEIISITPEFWKKYLLPAATEYLQAHSTLEKKDLFLLIPFLMDDDFLKLFNSQFFMQADNKQDTYELVDLFFAEEETVKRILTGLNSVDSTVSPAVSLQATEDVSVQATDSKEHSTEHSATSTRPVLLSNLRATVPVPQSAQGPAPSPTSSRKRGSPQPIVIHQSEEAHVTPQPGSTPATTKSQPSQKTFSTRTPSPVPDDQRHSTQATQQGPHLTIQTHTSTSELQVGNMHFSPSSGSGRSKSSNRIPSSAKESHLSVPTAQQHRRVSSDSDIRSLSQSQQGGAASGVTSTVTASPSGSPRPSVTVTSLTIPPQMTQPAAEKKADSLEIISPIPGHFVLSTPTVGMSDEEILELYRKDQARIMEDETYAAQQLLSAKKLDKAIKALTPAQKTEHAKLLAEVVQRANIAMVDPGNEENLLAAQALIEPLNKKRLVKVGLALGAIILGAVVVLVSTAAAVASFGGTSLFSLIGISIGTTLLAKSMSILCGVVGVGLIAGGMRLFSHYPLRRVVGASEEITDHAVKFTHHARP